MQMSRRREKKKKKKRKTELTEQHNSGVLRQDPIERIGENASSTHFKIHRGNDPNFHRARLAWEHDSLSLVARCSGQSYKNNSHTNNREYIALMHIHIHTRGSWKIEPEEEFRSKRETTYLSLTRHDLAGGTPSRERLFDRKHTRETVFDGNISTIYVSVPKFTACPRQLSCTCVSEWVSE